ncbi:MAG: hypothetical protein ABGW69_03065 [Nanoarchaeota archaeon]
MRTKIKQKGYLAEKVVKDKLKKYFYIPQKGISTKGVDIVALNKYLALVIEVKSFSNYLKIKKEQIKNLFEEERKIKEFFDIPVLKIVALVKNKEIKYCKVEKEEELKINEEKFKELNEFDYFLLLKEIE